MGSNDREYSTGTFVQVLERRSSSKEGQARDHHDILVTASLNVAASASSCKSTGSWDQGEII